MQILSQRQIGLPALHQKRENFRSFEAAEEEIRRMEDYSDTDGWNVDTLKSPQRIKRNVCSKAANNGVDHDFNDMLTYAQVYTDIITKRKYTLPIFLLEGNACRATITTTTTPYFHCFHFTIITGLPISAIADIVIVPATNTTSTLFRKYNILLINDIVI